MDETLDEQDKQLLRLFPRDNETFIYYSLYFLAQILTISKCPATLCCSPKPRMDALLFSIDLSYNDVKCGFEMLNEIGLAPEMCRANQI